MPNLINLVEKEVSPKGLDKDALPHNGKIKNYFFDKDYSNLKLLQNLPKQRAKHSLTLLYPGSGADILTPLLYLEELYTDLNEINCMLVDQVNNLGLIKTILDDVGISFQEEGNILKFYWKGILVTLEHVLANIFQIDLPSFDIYFEKAFRIMKQNVHYFEENIYHKLNMNGLLISDSGFQHLPLEKLNVPSHLSGYDEMIIGIKKE
tara:strand:+ start:65640 stop:66260 length:621 start_codon:yes stop_codon:yes gene_type:complete